MVPWFHRATARMTLKAVLGVLRLVSAALVVASLVALAAYAFGFAAVAVWTLSGARRRPTLADELDQVIAEILGLPPAEMAPGPSRTTRRD